MSLTNKKNKDINRLNRLGWQLSTTEALLNAHPLTSDHFLIVQNALKFLNFQTRWSLSGQLSRLLMTTQTALLGLQTADSAAGFVGPSLYKYQQAAGYLMTMALKSTATGDDDLLISLNSLVSCGFIYVMTQLGDWKQAMPKQDMGAARKGGWLFRELSLVFLVNSHFIELIFQSVAQGLGVGKKNQKIIADIGLFETLLLLILLAEEKNKKDEELIETLSRYMKPTTDSVEWAIQQARDTGKIDEDLFLTARKQLHLMRSTLGNGNLETLQEVIEDSLEAFDLLYDELRQDLKQAQNFCQQLDLSLQNIFDNKETTSSTHVNQIA